MHQPYIVGIGGTATPGSTTELALALTLGAAERCGARVTMLGCAHLVALPHYLTAGGDASPEARALLAAVRAADGIILASPGYHGTVSGLVKNAIDYLEETAKDARPYLDGLPVGLIATAYGWQAACSTLAALRCVVHALRGWPTPLGGATTGGLFKNGQCSDPATLKQLATIGQQVYEFAFMRMRGSGASNQPADAVR